MVSNLSSKDIEEKIPRNQSLVEITVHKLLISITQKILLLYENLGHWIYTVRVLSNP